MAKLAGLQFKFQYKKGCENKAAYALSRVGHVFAIQAVSTAQPLAARGHQFLQCGHQGTGVTHKIGSFPGAEQGYILRQGLIRYQGSIWVGANSGLHTKLIESFHASPVGGHSGIQATYQRVKKLFCWEGIKQDVQNFVQQCQICQQAKHENCKYPGLLNPLPIPTKAWEDVTMDFVEGLPKSNGFNVILVVADRYTKYSHFIPLKHPYATVVPFMQNIVKLNSMPLTITSDRDTIFTNHFWKELPAIWGPKLQMSTARHPQTDGQSERVNKCLEMYLMCAVRDSPTK